MSWEHDEWRAAVADMSEMDRAATALDARRTVGMAGDDSDAHAHYEDGAE